MRFGFKPASSLLVKYLLIVGSALCFLPITFLLVPLLLSVPIEQIDGTLDTRVYPSTSVLERMWHEEAANLGGASADVMDEKLKELRNDYPDARMFWVDGQGATRLQLPEDQSLPRVWSPAYTIQFMKERIGGDPFTVVAFLGNGQEEGFMVFEISRFLTKPREERLWQGYGMGIIGGVLLILAGFVFVSIVFFNRIRRRLIHLQTAMSGTSGSGIPGKLEVRNGDEIGRLEATFNDMVGKLEQSRVREAEEEALRRDLIAKLSHDLRTPLTTIRGHAFSLRGENLSERGIESTLLIEHKMEYLSSLIENLFSYSLLSAGKYPYRAQPTELVRTVKASFATWYPVFEQAEFNIELDLPESAVYWQIDPAWLERVLDNYFQNVLRHANAGRYIGLSVTAEQGGAITITDHGPGMGGESAEKGAGLGLSIIALMLKEMKLKSTIRSEDGETSVRIVPIAHA